MNDIKPNKIGRPTIYTIKLGLNICQLLSSGKSLRNICKQEGMPDISSVMLWLIDGKHKEFSEQYAHARVVQAENMFDELLDISDDSQNDWETRYNSEGEAYKVEDREVVNRSRLRVDTRKWYLSKVLPKKFGDKLDLTSDGKALPVPILGNVQSNNGNKKDRKP